MWFHTQEKRESVETNIKITLMLDLADKDFKTSYFNNLRW